MSTIIVTTVFMAVFVVYCGRVALPVWISWKMATIEFIVLFILFYLLLSGEISAYTKIICIIMLVIGLTVNPIAKGTESIYGNPIGKKISNIANRDRGLWLVEGNVREIIDYPIMFGAPTINSVNVYPALERWKKISPATNDKTVYNRYAHIVVNLTNNDKSSFSLLYADCFKIRLSLHDLKTLHVKYIFTRNNLQYLQTANVHFLELFNEHGFYIYKVECS